MQWFRERLLPDIAYPLLSNAFGYTLPASLTASIVDLKFGLRVVDAFIVKYNAAEGQRELRPHRDGSVFSFNVALNELDEYDGGGTSFRLLQRGQDSNNATAAVIRSDRGRILAHSSALVHGGNPIESGIRYVLVAFVSVDPALKAWASELYQRIKDIDDNPL